MQVLIIQVKVFNFEKSIIKYEIYLKLVIFLALGK